MIEIQNLCKNYGSIHALDHISFQVESGEIVGFLGPNGAGKTTTMNIMTGYISSTSGEAKICGYDVMEHPKEVKKRIGFLPEAPPLYPEMVVKSYLRFVAELKKVPSNKIKKEISDAMEVTKITDHSARMIRNLSKGYRQRVGLAQALIGKPEVLILDEPTVGLDPHQIIEIRNVIKGLGKEHTILLSSHILPEVSAVCDRIVIIDKGKITAMDTPQNLAKMSVGQKAKFVYTVVGSKNAVAKTLQNVQGIRKVVIMANQGEDAFSYEVETDIGPDVRKAIFYEMAKGGYPIIDIQTQDASLEDIFIQYTSGGANATQSAGKTQDKQKKKNEEDS